MLLLDALPIKLMEIYALNVEPDNGSMDKFVLMSHLFPIVSHTLLLLMFVSNVLLDITDFGLVVVLTIPVGLILPLLTVDLNLCILISVILAQLDSF